jgi:hypothetical protein
VKRELFVLAALLAAAPAGAAEERGQVCFGTASQGLVCLVEDRIRHYTARSGQLPGNRIADIKACGDRFVVSTGTALTAFDGREWSVPIAVRHGHAQRVSCTERGPYWVSLGGGVAVWDGGEWRHWEAASILPGIRGARVLDVAAAADGKAWVVLSEGWVAHWSDGRWEIAGPGRGLPGEFAFSRALVDRADRVWIAHRGGLVSYAARRWEEFEGPGLAAGIVEDPEGRFWLASGTRVRVFNAGVWIDRAAPFALRALAADANGAIWAATGFGIARLTAEGWQARRMHDSDLPDNDFTAVAAIGAAPPLPAAVEKAAGSVRGRLAWSDGRPMAGAAVEICEQPDAFADASPCDDRPLRRATTSDADGTFRFAATPPAVYRLVVKPPRGQNWLRDLADAEKLRQFAGQDRDGGDFVFDVSYRR